jgi:hypothetical protein
VGKGKNRTNILMYMVNTDNNEPDIIETINKAYKLVDGDMLNDAKHTVLDVTRGIDKVEWCMKKDGKFNDIYVITDMFGHIHDNERKQYIKIKRMSKTLIKKHIANRLIKTRYYVNFFAVFINAIEQNDIEFIKYLKNNNIIKSLSKELLLDVITANHNNKKLLRRAVKIFKMYDGNINARIHNHGQTILMKYVTHHLYGGDPNLYYLETLLKLGADPNFPTYAKKEGRTDPATSAMHEVMKGR